MNDRYNHPSPAPEGAVGAGQGAELQLPVCKRVLTTDLVGDFSLPDYQPEIKRLLRIIPSITPPERYISGDSVDLDGVVDYFVLYMGNDNGLYCAPLSTDYRLTLPLREERDGGHSSSNAFPADGQLTCACDVTADPVTGRVISPRRLNIKCRLSADVKAYGTYLLTAEGEGEMIPPSAERLTDTVETARLSQGLGEPLPLQDDMVLPATDGRESRVVCAEGSVLVTEAVAGMNTVTCRGEALLKLTLCPAEATEGDETLPVISTRKIPFSQTVELAGVTPDCTACAHGVCSELSVEVEEGQLHSEMSVVLEVLTQQSARATYTKDLYLPRRQSAGRHATYSIRRPLGCFNGNFTLSDSLLLSEAGIHPNARVMDVTATAFPEALTADPEKNRYVLTGRCRVHLLTHREGEYASNEVEFPFRYEKESLSGSRMSENGAPEFDGTVKAVTCRVRMDGERLGIDAELAVALRMTTPDTLTALSTVAFGDEVVRRAGEYVICFPSHEDTLWSVAKRYQAPLAAFGAANGIPASEDPSGKGSLKDINFLIV